MTDPDNARFIAGLQEALAKERATNRIYTALALRETNEARRRVLLKLAATEAGHADRWARRLAELGVPIPPEIDPLRDRVWRWLLVQQGTNQALARIEQAEEDDTAMYGNLVTAAPTEADREALNTVRRDEATHGRLAHDVSTPGTASPQARLDTILGRERWHHHSGGWIGQAIYGANDGLGSVFGIVTGVAGATAGGEAVLIAGLAGMLASALSMGSGAYLATKADREIQEAEIERERRELERDPEEEKEELALFYQLKGVPEAEARQLTQRLMVEPENALRTLASEELGLSAEGFPNPWVAATSATLSTAAGAFIPIIPFFFARGYTAVIASFAISTVAHFLIGAAKTVVTGLSPWKSGFEMTAVGLGEALITYGLGLIFGGFVH
jgi:vacuolar iron transporter family protein